MPPMTAMKEPMPRYCLPITLWSTEKRYFDQKVVGVRGVLNVSSDLQLASFVQYDDESETIGTNTRLRWTFDPLGELFLVYNYNVVDRLDRWALDGTQFMVKVQYALRR